MTLPDRIPEPKCSELDNAFLKRSRKMEKDPETHHLIRMLMEGVETANASVVDVACGAGSFTYTLASATSQPIIGIDTDKKALDIARKNYGNTDNLEFKEGDAYKLTQLISDQVGKVGLATIHTALHHFDDLDGILNQVTTILNPSGKLLMLDFDRQQAYNTPQASGLSRKQRRKIDRVLNKHSGEKALNILRKEKLLSHPGSPTYFSFLAAYTADEIKPRLEQRGFTCDVSFGKNPTYGIVAHRGFR